MLRFAQIQQPPLAKAYELVENTTYNWRQKAGYVATTC